ncbi:DNA polymerase III subunit beta [Spirosoma utsteinense]|uniref:Beta sliding clamp n=1 Tax=Spirosoma utsteinense TaxID=2585773 RepID=A0ABR6W558_9BACT|nr:DNA polymerase III subunit beta [Spirosoma utsteinense]MBC3785361.1 DNA polymerase-3 subunit beta [Spirosoma utsteinense]MBC3791612.1 DNA polymerase-3 subunit beta [Spirosoma utsteinense]
MKFIVSSSVLLKNLQNINGVVATNPIVPILENFLFRIEDGTLTVTASDLQTTMTTQIPVEASENGAIAIPAKLLLDTLRSLPEQPVTINIDTETFGTEILTDNGRYKLSGENPIDFPKLPTVSKTMSVDMTSDVLLGAINNTVFATSTDDLRPAMTGVYLQLSDDNATFVATDGHRLIRYRRTDLGTGSTSGAATTSLIIPRKALQLLKASLPENVPVVAEFSQANASFTFGPTQLICRLIDERFPDYENAIPTNNPNVMTIGRTDLLNSLKRIMIYANRTTHQIRLSLKTNSLTISAEDLDYSNEANEKLLCDYDGEAMEIGFNAKLMAEVLSNLSAKMITLEMSAPNRAGLLIPADKEENEDILMLVMPVMLNTYA